MDKRMISIITAVVLAVSLAPSLAFASDGFLAASAVPVQVSSSVAHTQAVNAKTAKKARKAYKSYLAKHPSYKRFKVVKMGNGGVPVLLCSKQPTFTYLGPDYIISTNVVIYDKSRKQKVKNLGTIGTGGTACRLQYVKGAVCGYRIADLHTFTKVTVKNGHLSMSGMYDNMYGPTVKWRHFSNYNPKTMGSLWESKALGRKGAKSEYYKLVRKYGNHPLVLHRNTKTNRVAYI